MDDRDRKLMRAQLNEVVDYHKRRLREMAKHQASLDAVVFPDLAKQKIHRKTDRSLLGKPLAYQTLVNIWIGSPYIEGSDDWTGIECETVYSLAADFSFDGLVERPALMRYVGRVVDAATRQGLVIKGDAETKLRKVPLRATELLHSVMVHQALSADREND